MSSKYTTINFLMKFFRTSFMRSIKVLGVLDRLKGMTNRSYNPYLVLKVVFHSSLSFILILWYLLLRSILEKTLDLCNSSNISSNWKIENLYLMVILFIALKSTHIHQVPSFLSIKRVGTKHGLKLSQIDPQLSNSWTYYWNSFDSLGLHLQVSLLGKGASGRRSI